MHHKISAQWRMSIRSVTKVKEKKILTQRNSAGSNDATKR